MTTETELNEYAVRAIKLGIQPFTAQGYREYRNAVEGFLACQKCLTNPSL